MADFTRQTLPRPRIAVPRRPVDEEISPSSEWTNDFPGFHCLLVNLPGYNEDDIKVNVDKSGIIVVSGRRKDEKHEHYFEKTFNVPEYGDVNNIIKIFDGATLRVRIPKVPKTEIKKPSSADAASTNNINTNETRDEYEYEYEYVSDSQGKESDNFVLNGDTQREERGRTSLVSNNGSRKF